MGKFLIFCRIQLKLCSWLYKKHHESFSSKKQVIKKLSPKSLWQTYMKWTVAHVADVSCISRDSTAIQNKNDVNVTKHSWMIVNDGDLSKPSSNSVGSSKMSAIVKAWIQLITSAGSQLMTDKSASWFPASKVLHGEFVLFLKKMLIQSILDISNSDISNS